MDFYLISKKTLNGQLVGIPTNSNNLDHGCADYAVARIVDERQKTMEGYGIREDCTFSGHEMVKAVVVEGESCHSCWQVGHDSEHVFWPVGQEIFLKISDLKKADPELWSSSVVFQLNDSDIERGEIIV